MTDDLPGDAELVTRTLTGETAAFGDLYDRHARLVRGVVASVSADWEAMDDMTQETFLRAYRKLGELSDRDKFAAWISGIARHVARERKRSQRRDRHLFVGESLNGRAAAQCDLANVDQADEMGLIMRHLSLLTERERSAIHAFYFEECDGQKGAALLNVSRSGFYGLLQRGIARLSALIQSERPSEPTTK